MRYFYHWPTWILDPQCPARSLARPTSIQTVESWSLACNHAGDLIFMYTHGYGLSYIMQNCAPGGATFRPTFIKVKSRESNYLFDVLELPYYAECSRDQMVEYAVRWDGYEVVGDEKEYYKALIEKAMDAQEEPKFYVSDDEEGNDEANDSDW